MTFVLDASVALTWLLDEAQTRNTRPIRIALRSRQALVPAIWPLEVGNTVIVSERRGRASVKHIQEFLEALGSFDIRIDHRDLGHSLGTVLEFAREHQLSTYDASYLELAFRLGIPLATLDKELRAAAKKVKVDLFDG